MPYQELPSGSSVFPQPLCSFPTLWAPCSECLRLALALGPVLPFSQAWVLSPFPSSPCTHKHTCPLLPGQKPQRLGRTGTPDCCCLWHGDPPRALGPDLPISLPRRSGLGVLPSLFSSPPPFPPPVLPPSPSSSSNVAFLSL